MEYAAILYSTERTYAQPRRPPKNTSNIMSRIQREYRRASDAWWHHADRFHYRAVTIYSGCRMQSICWFKRTLPSTEWLSLVRHSDFGKRSSWTCHIVGKSYQSMFNRSRIGTRSICYELNILTPICKHCRLASAPFYRLSLGRRQILYEGPRRLQAAYRPQ